MKSRAAEFGFERAKFDSGSVSVRVEASSQDKGKSNDDSILKRIQQLSGLGPVREIVIRSEEGPSVRCRIPAQVATVERSQRVSAAELGWIACWIVLNLSEVSARQIHRVLYGVEADSGDDTQMGSPRHLSDP